MSREAAAYYTERAKIAESRGASGAAEDYRAMAAKLLGEVETPAVMDVPPASWTVTSQASSPPPFANMGMVVPPEKDMQAPVGLERDVLSDSRVTADVLDEFERRIIEYEITVNNATQEEAEALARKELRSIESMRFNVEGEREASDIESWFAPGRESRIYTRREVDEDGKPVDVDYYWDVDEQDWRKPTRGEHLVEAFAKQEIMSPEKIGQQMTQIRQRAWDITKQYNLDVNDPKAKELFDETYRREILKAYDEMFMYTRPGTARTIESAIGASLRSVPAIWSTFFNTALFNYTPYVWEMDPETGEPVDPDSWSYRIHQGMTDLLTETGGMSEEEAKKAITGEIQNPLVGVWNTFNPASGPARWIEKAYGPDIAAGYRAVFGEEFGGVAGDLTRLAMNPPEDLGIILPFQPVLRNHATSIDPYGVRVASTTGDFIIDYATALRRGRSLGDELMSIPGLREERVEEWYRAQKDYKESSKAGENTVYKHMGTTAPYWYGVMTEMGYGFGPISGLKHAVRLTTEGIPAVKLPGLIKAAETVGATGVAKAARTVAHPVEAAKLSRTRRVLGDLIEADKLGKETKKTLLDATLDASEVRRVAGEVGGGESQTPYLIQAYLQAGGRDGAALNALIEGTEIGPYLVKRGGYPPGRFPATVPENAVKRIDDLVYEWRAEAFRPGVMQIASAKGVNPAVRLKQVQEFLHEAGLSKKVFPQIDNPDNLSLTDWIKQLYPKGARLAGATPVTPGNAVQLQIHTLGSNIVKAARSDTATTLPGELGRIVHRRMGALDLDVKAISSRVLQVAEAAKASAGRAIEAAIENVIPDNFVFVTRSLIAPRSKVTVKLLADVKERMQDYRNAFTVKASATKVDGKAVNEVFVNPKMAAPLRAAVVSAFGMTNIRRDRDLSRIYKALDEPESAVLSEGDKAYILEGLETEVFRKLLTVDGRSAGRTAFGGRQTEKAMVEGVNVGVDILPSTRVARRGAVEFVSETIPLLISEAGGRYIKMAKKPLKDDFLVKWPNVRASIKAAQDWLNRAFGDDLPFEYGKVTLQPMQRLIEEIRSRVGSIGDNFSREVRALTQTARRNGDANPGATAINRMGAERISVAVQRKVQQAQQEALRLQDSGMGESQAWYRIAHGAVADQTEATGKRALGTQVGESLAPDGKPWKDYTIDNIKASVMEDTWSKLLSLFFNGNDYRRIKDAVPRTVAKGESPSRATRQESDYFPVTLENLKVVIGKLREAAPELKTKGKGTTIFGLPTTFKSNSDAITQVFLAWMAGADRTRIVDDALEAMRIRHPEVWVDLIPSAYSRQPKLAVLEQQLTKQNREGVFRKLMELGVDPKLLKAAKDKAIAAGATPGAANKAAQDELNKIVQGLIDDLGRKGYFDALVMTPDDWSARFGLAPMRTSGGKDSVLWGIQTATAKMYNAFTPKVRKQMVDKVLEAIFQEGTININIGNLKDDVFELAFKKDATALELMTAFHSARWRSFNNIALSDEENMFMEFWQYAVSRKEEAMFDARDQKLREMGEDPQDMLPSELRLAVGETKADRDVAYDLAEVLAQNAFNTLVVPVVEEILSNARNLGFTPGTGSKSLNNVVAEVANINPYNPAMLYAGSDYVEALKKLQSAATSGRLVDNLKALNRRDQFAAMKAGKDPQERAKAAGEAAWGILVDAVTTNRTIQAGGLLAGGYYVAGQSLGDDYFLPLPIPVPNMRYIGMNLLTAPLIALTTVGAAGAIKAARGPGFGTHLRDVAKQAEAILPRPSKYLPEHVVDRFVNAIPGKLVDAATPRRPDEIVFTSQTGRRWTWAEFREAADRNNIQITRGSIEFQEAWIRDLMRDARIKADGTPPGKFRQFLRNVDLRRTNFFQYAANATDRAFRENMFASALKEGIPEQQAAQLARGVVLDYGRIPEAVRGPLNRVLLFLTFRLSMTAELIDALARDPGVFNRKLLAIRDSQQASEQYLYGADYTKSRIVLDPTTYIYDNKAGAMFYGPSEPSVQAFQDLISLGHWVVGWFDPEVNSSKTAARAITEENLNPFVSKFLETVANTTMRETDQGWKVPDWALAWATHNDVFPMLKNKFNLKPVLQTRSRIPGRPSFRESTDENFVEWYFPSVKEMESFKAYLFIATSLGMKRSTEEGTKNIMAHHDSDLIKEQRRGDVPKWAFTTGLLTPIGAPGPEQVMSQSLFEVRRAAKEQRPKYDR